MAHPHSADIAQALVDWFSAHGRDYPWRRTTDPWAILVSEVMLQQTTIATVLGRYEAWMQQFPTPAELAAATEEQALRSWEGLGYYRRVRALKAAAEAIVSRHGGRFPTEEKDIRALPGIGDYTVGAVLSFAFNKSAALVDANVARVFSRLFDDFTPIDSPAGRKQHWQWAAAMVHPTETRLYNSALMELGQTICTGGRPDCLLCPLRAFCLTKTPEQLPIKLPKKEITNIEHWDILCINNAAILLERQTEGKRHQGMYRLPRRAKEIATAFPLLAQQKYSITRYKVTRYLHQAPPNTQAENNEEFIPIERIHELPLASPDRKILQKIAL